MYIPWLTFGDCETAVTRMIVPLPGNGLIGLPNMLEIVEYCTEWM